MMMTNAVCAWPRCTREAVNAIIEDRDPELRNLAITQSYYQFTQQVGRRLGGRDLPWTGFAVWASKTAGLFIRRDWLPEWLYESIARCGGAAAERIDELDRRLKQHVARGNRAVYAEIGPLFAELIDILDAPASQRAARTEALVATLRPGPVQQGGQDPLAYAMRAYVAAADCDDDVVRAQHILLANIWIGYQEQWRLQPEITGSLDAVFTLLPPARAGWHRRLQRRAAYHLRQLMTRFMIICTPETPLRLGRDLPGLACGRMFPPELETLQLPPLQEVVARVDRTPDTIAGTAADDWASFDDRMNFLVDLFRSRQRLPALWRAPFTATQVQMLQHRALPPGQL